MTAGGGWLKVPFTLARDPRVMKAGPEAGMILVSAWAYAHEHMTDGKIPKVSAFMLFPVTEPAKAVAALVESGLWIEDGDDYVLDGFLDWNADKATREVEREKKAKAGRARQKKCAAASAQHVLSTKDSTCSASAGASAQREEKRREEGFKTPNGVLQPLPPAPAAQNGKLFETQDPETPPDAVGSAAKRRKSKPRVDTHLENRRAFRASWLDRWAKSVEGVPEGLEEAELRNRAGWAQAENKLLKTLMNRLGPEEIQARANRFWSGQPAYLWREGVPTFKDFAGACDKLVQPKAGQAPGPSADDSWYRSRRLPEPSKALLWIDLAIKSAIPGTPFEEQRQEVRQRLIDEAGDLDIGPAFRVAIEFLETLRNASEFDARKTIKPQIQSAYVATCRESVRESA